MKKQLLREKGGRFCRLEVELTGGRLSICGSEGRVGGPSRRGDTFLEGGKAYTIESCGQIREALAQWFPEAVPFLGWHLNDMRAGCAHQRAEGWSERPIDPSKPLDAYGEHLKGSTATWNMLAWVSPSEHPEGLLSKPCPTCGYKYGTAWLREELPPEVIAWVESL